MGSGDTSYHNAKLRERYKTHRISIDEDVLSVTMSLLDYDLKTSYAVLGAQLAQIERPYHAFQTTKMMGFGEGLYVPKISVDYVSEGYNFTKNLWTKLIPPVCRWWRDNKGKEKKDLMKGICAIITYVLSMPYNLIQGIISVIAVIVVKHGLEKLCTIKDRVPYEPSH